MVDAINKLRSVHSFASRIDHYEVPDCAELNAELLEAVAKWRADDPGLQVSNVTGWHSPTTLFSREEPAFQKLVKAIRGALIGSVRGYWPEFDPLKHPFLTEGWVNVSGNGAMNMPHTHAMSNLSGCYYVATPGSDVDRSGTIEFQNPAGGLKPMNKFAERMIFEASRIDPHPGLLLIFPGYLRHMVYPNYAETDRVTIAFNMTILDQGRPRQARVATTRRG
ncbi:hypothetical protein B2G71_14810 [Novosphingobium sp. PC22D]|uniref:TIGR02466 family protein n=1 Tax=Novosphingobium sp. PC22D TaxID=1962403 RepID=UPI000BFAB753|nr:TIGR02466 family protein [Novosphingobium sp. PC22D]PEQ11724.1 hypothetical protein B2G71_14810 [Novosphingobium sp. PC22D]